jgi:small conductance mechanosensitive channel
VLEDWLENKKIEPPIRMLAVRVTRMLAFGMALVLALEKAGVPIAPVIAGISVAGVGIGLAMQGVLGNLMAGLTIIFTKPFKVGQYIEILNVQGQVTNIELFTTTLLHTDRSKVVIPNRKIVGEILHNYGLIRQLDLTVGVAYATDIEQALQAVRQVLQDNPRVLKDPPPVVGVVALADSSINIAMKPWTAVADFNPASAEIYQGVVNAFRAQHIEIPFPQREVKLLQKG